MSEGLDNMVGGNAPDLYPYTGDQDQDQYTFIEYCGDMQEQEFEIFTPVYDLETENQYAYAVEELGGIVEGGEDDQKRAIDFLKKSPTELVNLCFNDLIRQLEKRNRRGSFTLAYANPLEAAKLLYLDCFTYDGVRALHFYREDYLIYSYTTDEPYKCKPCYRNISKMELRKVIYQWLSEQETMRVEDQGPVYGDYYPTKARVDQVLDALNALCLLSDDIELPYLQPDVKNNFAGFEPWRD